jgi:hypothetical protein
MMRRFSPGFPVKWWHGEKFLVIYHAAMVKLKPKGI